MSKGLIRQTLIAALCVVAAPAFAESLTASASSAGSSASSAGSASLRGSSDSLRSSSDSSKEDERAAVTDGDYRVAAVETIDGQPDMLRLTMEPVAAPGAERFQLDLPQRALGAQPITAGDLVAAQHRPYGLEFARGATREAFFLVLADDWTRDLDTRLVVR